jgi:hypothetical protein
MTQEEYDVTVYHLLLADLRRNDVASAATRQSLRANHLLFTLGLHA